MKFNTLADIYSANVGDKLTLDKNTTVINDIYIEAMVNNKWVLALDHLLNNTYIVEVLKESEVKNKNIVDHIVNSGFHGIEDDGRLLLKIPNHINHNSLRTKLYSLVKGYSVDFFEDTIIVKIKTDSFNKNIISEDFHTGDTKTINKCDCKNITSTISHLYKLAANAGIIISIKNNPRSIVITHKGITDTDTVTESFTAQANNWLNKLPYDTAVDIPTRFTDLKTSAYINTVLHKSKFATKVYNGRVTKLKGAIKKAGGKLNIIVNENVIKTINRSSLTSITKRDRMVIDLVLKPYKLTYKDIR